MHIQQNQNVSTKQPHSGVQGQSIQQPASELDPERATTSASTDLYCCSVEASTIQQPIGHHSTQQPIQEEGDMEDAKESESESDHDSDRFSTGDYCGNKALLDSLMFETTEGGTLEQQFDETQIHSNHETIINASQQPDSQANDEATGTYSSQYHDAQQRGQKK